MTKYGICFELQLKMLKEEGRKGFTVNKADHLKRTIKNIDIKYLWSVKPNVLLFLLNVYALLDHYVYILPMVSETTKIMCQNFQTKNSFLKRI